MLTLDISIRGLDAVVEVRKCDCTMTTTRFIKYKTLTKVPSDN